ncbi:PC-Esterase [Corchorus olitorius]|uniref:PC-Esterase n=1 Tax=Corchorus olitorius TaxID=93759 RepID=A0A1R3GDE8_9ROSI|nr:PC-Esterase [Corchorus olitorius]
MAIVLQHSRTGSLESIGMVGEYALSTQHHQHTEPSPSLSSEEQFIESSSSANNDQLTESPASAPGPDEATSIESSSSGEYQSTNASPPSAQGPSPVSSPVLNTGQHWTVDKFTYRGVGMYVNGKLIEKKLELEDMRNARNFTVHSIVRWLDSQVALYPRLKAFFRSNSPSHFRGGEWNTGGSCNNTIPLTQGSEVLQDESSDKDVVSAVKGTKVKILDITAISELRDEAHISISHSDFNGINDCLHWCLPGVPDTWNELLIAQI